MAPLVGDPGGNGDVLVARATAPGPAAVAIVRLSGPAGRTMEVARGVAPGLPARLAARKAVRARFVDEDGAEVDEGLVLWFAAPASATGEEVVELHAHGAPVVVETLVSACVARGARRARPGEFTRRALSNGKLDLARAEGIGGLAAAATRSEARRALGVVRGELSRRVAAARETLLEGLAELEARLDFAEDVEACGEETVLRRLADAREALRALGGEAGAGRRVAGRPTVVIVGAPNAGKSTLFNALLGEDRALVTEVPGTTRDVVSEEAQLGDALVRLVDTAGLRESADPLERLGVEAARRAASGADLVVLAREPGGDAPAGALPAGTPVLHVGTKADLSADPAFGGPRVSARTGAGLEELRREIAARVGAGGGDGEWDALPRQREALRRAAAALQGVDAGVAAELAAASVRRALHALGEVTGETATEELLDRVFSAFCVGK